MNYIICVSGFHRKLAEDIQGKEIGDSVVINLDKAKALKDKLYNVITGAFWCFAILLDRRSCVFVPHPWGPWFSIMIKLSRKVSLYDDGTAYYFNSPIPRGYLCKVYNILARKLHPETHKSVEGEAGYYDYLKDSKAVDFYCLFPEKLSTCAPVKRKASLVKLKRAKKAEIEALFLDSSKSFSGKYDDNDMLLVLEEIARSTAAGVIYYKPHPRSVSKLSQDLHQKNWALPLQGDFEDILISKGVQNVYALYSTGLISAKLLSPDTNAFCFILEKFVAHKNLIDIYQELDVKMVDANR